MASVAVEGSGSRRLDLERFELGARRRSCGITALDPVLRDWWILRLFFAFWLEVRSALRVVVVAFVVSGGRAGDALLRWREEEEGLEGLRCVCSEDKVLSAKWCIWSHQLYPPRSFLYLYVDLFGFLSTI